MFSLHPHKLRQKVSSNSEEVQAQGASLQSVLTKAIHMVDMRRLRKFQLSKQMKI